MTVTWQSHLYFTKNGKIALLTLHFTGLWPGRGVMKGARYWVDMVTDRFWEASHDSQPNQLQNGRKNQLISKILDLIVEH